MQVESTHRSRLDAVQTLVDLRAYAEALYASGDLDESEQMTTSDPDYGWLAPWSVPQSAEVLDDSGEDVTVRLPSGELARWRNSRREWGSVDASEL